MSIENLRVSLYYANDSYLCLEAVCPPHVIAICKLPEMLSVINGMDISQEAKNALKSEAGELGLIRCC